MGNKQIIGIVLAVLGVGLAFWGYRLAGGFGSQVTQAFSGSPSDKVMMFYIGGAISLAAGLFMLLKK
jgi:hypothetical protein